MMKKLIFLTLLASLWGAKAQAADIYFAQLAAGGNTGVNCANARALSTHAIGDDVAGNTLHLCGTITGGAGSTLLTILANGSSGNPITVKFETGAILQAPYFGTNANGPGGGAIRISNRSFIVIDGGTPCGYINGVDVACNGVIQNTANGSLLANKQISTGISADPCSNCEIKNLTIANIYVHVSPEGSINQTDSIAISMSGSNWSIHNNTIHDCGWCVHDFFQNGNTQHDVYNNHIYNMDHGYTPGGANAYAASNFFFHNNHLGSMANWDVPFPGGPCGSQACYHHDGVHAFGGGSSNLTNLQVYSNLFDGNPGQAFTSYVYIERPDAAPSETNPLVYNNVFDAHLEPGGNFGLLTFGAVPGGQAYNNTFLGVNINPAPCMVINGGNTIIKNNIFSGCWTGTWFPYSGIGSTVYNNNTYANMGACGLGFTVDAVCHTTLANWQSTSGQDANSQLVANAGLDAAYKPVTGSPVINFATNLTSLGITALNSDKSGTGRPTTGPWTGGAFNSGGVATPSLTMSPNPAAFGTVTVGGTSSPITVTVTSNGTATATLGSPVATFSDPTFSNVGTGTCVINQSLPVGSSCTIVIQFKPVVSGAKSGTMLAGGNTSASINLSGTGGTSTTSMSIAPTTFNFGNVPQHVTSATQNFTITNTGTTTITLNNPTVTTFGGAFAADWSLATPSSGTCNAGMAMTPGQTCVKIIQGTPSIIGLETGTVTVSATTASATANIQMTGTGSSSIQVTPKPVNFPSTTVGTTSSALTATVTNNGSTSVTLSTPFFVISGTNSADFARLGGTCTNGGSLAAAATCTVTVTFSPTISGAESGLLTVNSATASDSTSLQGTGIIPTPIPGIALSPSGGVSFGSQVVGTTSSVQTVTVSSTGTANLVLNTPYFTLTGTNAADVTNTGAGTCANGQTLTPGSTCTITLTFNPAGAGARAATLNVNGNASGSLALSGTGIAAVVTLTSAPSPVAFGSVTQSTPSAVQTVTITNTGNVTATLQTPYFTVTGTNAADFSNAGTGTCANGGSLAAAASCTVKLIFTPSILGAETATLTVSTTGAVSTTDILNGTGVAPTVPSISISPDPANLGSVNVGSSSGGTTITITNSGTATLILANPFFTITGANSSDFSRFAGSCVNGGTVATSASCTIIVIFSPSAAGSRTATLNIAGNASKSSSLTGTGVALVAVLTPTPNPASFGTVIQGSTSSPVTVTVQNTGNTSTTFLTPFFSLTGANAADFVRTGGTCANGNILAVSGTCTVILTFTPSTNTAETATLNLFSTFATGTATLNGTGQATPNLPAPSVIIIGLFPLPSVTIQGTGFKPGTMITIDGVAQVTICSTSKLCKAQLGPEVLLLPGWGVIGHAISVK